MQNELLVTTSCRVPPKNSEPSFGALMMRTIVYWGPFRGPPFMETLHAGIGGIQGVSFSFFQRRLQTMIAIYKETNSSSNVGWYRVHIQQELSFEQPMKHIVGIRKVYTQISPPSRHSYTYQIRINALAQYQAILRPVLFPLPVSPLWSGS